MLKSTKLQSIRIKTLQPICTKPRLLDIYNTEQQSVQDHRQYSYN